MEIARLQGQGQQEQPQEEPYDAHPEQHDTCVGFDTGGGESAHAYNGYDDSGNELPYPDVEHAELGYASDEDNSFMDTHFFPRSSEVKVVDIRDCKHSQMDISPVFSKEHRGMPLEKLIEVMYKDPSFVLSHQAMILDAMWVRGRGDAHGHYRVIDNRRLYCLRKAFPYGGQQVRLKLVDPMRPDVAPDVRKFLLNTDSFDKVRIRRKGTDWKNSEPE